MNAAAPKKGKILGPPKGAAITLDAAGVLESRFDHRRDDERPATPSPAAEPDPVPAAAETSKATKPHRPDPAGMTRRTYYLAAGDADALEAAVDRVQAATKGLVAKHRVYAAVFRHGTERLDEVIAELTAELLKGLTPPT